MKLTFALPLPERPSENLPAAPALNAMLRRARRTSDKGFDIRMLWRGSLRRLLAAEAGLPPDAPCVLAAPVSQRMGMNQAHLASGRILGITPTEAAAWCAGLTEFFADAGWRFYPCHADLWLLALPQPPRWQDVPSVWQSGGQADGMERAERHAPADWLAAQTEMQMWLHAHPLNAARAAPVNGVWLWDDTAGASPYGFVAANESCAFLPNGRAAPAAPTDWHALHELLDAQPQPVSDGLIVPDAPDDADAFAAWAADADARLFAPALAALNKGRLKTLVLLAEGGDAFALTRYSRFAFWRRGA